MSEITGLEEVMVNLNKKIKDLNVKGVAGLIKAGVFIGNLSQKECPVVTGNLKNSFYTKRIWQSVELPGVKALEIGYTAAYAPFVHENPRAGDTKGVSPKGKPYKPPINKETGRRSTKKVYSTVGKWKFLEDPIKQNTKNILEIIAKGAKKATQ